MRRIAPLKLGVLPIPSSDDPAAFGRPASAPEWRDPFGVELPERIVGGQFLPRSHDAARHERDLVRHPDVRIAPVVQEVVAGRAVVGGLPEPRVALPAPRASERAPWRGVNGLIPGKNPVGPHRDYLARADRSGRERASPVERRGPNGQRRMEPGAYFFSSGFSSRSARFFSVSSSLDLGTSRTCCERSLSRGWSEDEVTAT